MKSFILSSLLFFSLSSFLSLSFTEVISAIESGNASQVTKFFDNTVEITLPGKSNSYSKSQAELVLHDFFLSNQVKSFQVIHKSDNAGSQYCIGNLNTSSGVFRTTIYMKQKGDKLVVQELRFER